jgi:hypothetical protein
MANNFLNRKKLDLNLLNRDGYKKSDAKKTLVHSFMKSPVSHVPSVFPYNPNQLGFAVPYMHAKQVPYELHEQHVFVDSADRNIATNPSPYKLNVRFGINDYSLVVPHPPPKHVKYINIDNVILPHLYELNSESIANDVSFNSSITAFISSDQIAINGEYTVGTKVIQVCNLQVASNGDWNINYTENRVNTTVYNVVKNGVTYITSRYTIGSSYASKKTVYMKIDNIKSNLLSTNQYELFQQLYPKKIISDSLWFNIKKGNTVFRNGSLPNMSKLDISFVDEFGNLLQIYNLDFTATSDKYADKNAYASPTYYIRHPLHKKWQSHVTLKIGVVHPYLQPSL